MTAADSGLTSAAASGPGSRPGCVFCQIASGQAPTRFEHLLTREGDLIAHTNVVAFHNRLDRARVMLLVVPRAHFNQAELWTGPVLAEAASFAVRLGEKLCPEGFRVLSNFGRPAHQSQEHAHIHVISAPDTGLPETFEDASGRVISHGGGIYISPIDVAGVPWSARVTADGARSQRALWMGESFLACGAAAIDLAGRETPEGFRFISNFFSPATGIGDGGEPGLLILGGGQLDLYA